MRRNPSLGWIRFRRAVAPHSEAVSAGAIGVLRPVQIAVKPIQTRCQPDANSEQKESNRTGNEGPEIMAERHNAPQHNLHANQAGNAGDCISSAHSSQPWRRVGRFFATTVLASFVLNEVWEMAQMSAYVETAGHSWMSTLGLCTLAAVGDVGIILGIYAAGALAAGDLFWGWLMRRWWNMQRWPPGAGRTRRVCLWCPCLAQACGRYSK